MRKETGPTSGFTRNNVILPFLDNPIRGEKPMAGRKNIAPERIDAPDVPKGPGLFSGIKWDKLELRNALPFMTNIVNSLRRPPLPASPMMNRGVTLSDPNLNVARTEAKQAARAAQLGAEQSLPAAQAGALKAAIYGTQAEAMSKISEKEALMRGEKRDRQAMINAQVEAGNNAKVDQFNDDVVNRKIAMQRENSENLSNAVDKNIAMSNQNAERDMDFKKYQLLLEAYKLGGVGQRADERVKAAGIRTTNRFGGQLGKVYALGGTLGGGERDPKLPASPNTYNSQQEIDQANAFARDFANRKYTGGGEEVYVARNVGDPKVQFSGATGVPPSKLPTTVPDYVTLNDIKSAQGKYWYENNNGDIVDIDPSVVSHPKFRRPKLGMGGRLRKIAY